MLRGVPHDFCEHGAEGGLGLSGKQCCDRLAMSVQGAGAGNDSMKCIPLALFNSSANILNK